MTQLRSKNQMSRKEQASKRVKIDHSAGRFSEEQRTCLHEQGFLVLSQLINVNSEFLTSVQSQQSRAAVIFNQLSGQGDTVRGDGKRKQFQLDKSGGVIKKAIATLSDRLFALSGQKPQSWVGLQSRPGCQEQPPHADFPPMGLSDEQMPLAVLVALMPGTTVQVWPGSLRYNGYDLDKIQKTSLSLNPGDVFLFRGDLVHAGSAYADENFRLHAVLVNPENPVKYSNQTWLIEPANS